MFDATAVRMSAFTETRQINVALKRRYNGRRINKTITEEVGVTHVVWDTDKWGRKCRAHVEGVEDSRLLKGVTQDVGGLKGRPRNQQRDFKSVLQD
jgi:hypothetical protein